MSCCPDGYGEPCMDCEDCLGEIYWDDVQPWLPGLAPPQAPPGIGIDELNASILQGITASVLDGFFTKNDALYELLKKRSTAEFTETTIQENYIYEKKM